MSEYAGKAEILADLQQRVDDKILEPSNYALLKKLVDNADTLDEAIKIAELGTTYRRTGFHFDKKLEKDSDTISYFKKNEELSFETDKNSITHKLIIGDNYPALLNLLVEYRGNIDVIYLDPPYGKDSMGEFAQTNYENAISRDNLLSMLYPRLWLAKQLLSDKGLIFCSIDDRNQAYVRGLFDEIFGEKNFIANFCWMKTATPPSLSKKVRKKMEYVLCFANEASGLVLNGGIVEGGDMPLLNEANGIATLTIPKSSINIKIKEGIYQKGSYHNIELIEDVEIIDGKISSDLVIKGRFKWQQSTVDKEVQDGTQFWIKSDKFSIRYARLGERVKTPSNLITKEECGVLTNEKGNDELTEIFNEKIFDHPKPTSLIKYLINMHVDNPKTVLDFFAGSGTTGQAVLELNKGGATLQYICVQLDEQLEKVLEDENKKTSEEKDRDFVKTTENQIKLLRKLGRPLLLSEVIAERFRRIMTGMDFNKNKIDWANANQPFGENLLVLEIAEVANFETNEGKTPFDVIDETLYGKEVLGVTEKTKWVCENFEATQKRLQTK